MTAVRTKFEAGCYAVTASSQKMIILDRFKKITVASVDNFKPLFDAMTIAPEKDINIEHLSNASILYAMGSELGIELGMFADGDKAVIAFCRSQISDEINPEDIDILLQELSASWQYIAKHPLLIKYIQLGEYMSSDGIDCQFSPLGAFELFVHDYFTGCVRAFIKSGANELVLLKEWVNLIFSALHGMGMCNNRFLKTEFFLTKVKQILDETGPHRAQVEAFALKTKQGNDIFKSMWFVNIRDYAKFELEDIETLEDASVSLTELLENIPCTTNQSESELQLTELRKQFMAPLDALNPLMKTCDFSAVSSDIVELNKLIKEVIVYAIVTYALENDIRLYPQLTPMPLPAYRLAGKDEAAEEELIKQLLGQDANTVFLPFELYAITKKARSQVLKDIVNQVINARAKYEEIFSLTNILGNLSIASVTSLAIMNTTRLRSLAVTHQYRRLQGVLVGKRPSGRSMLLQAVQSQEQPKQVNSDEEEAPANENPKDALHETLNLQKPASCTLL